MHKNASFPTFDGPFRSIFGLVYPIKSMWVFFRSNQKLDFGMTKSFNFFDEIRVGTKNVSNMVRITNNNNNLNSNITLTCNTP